MSYIFHFLLRWSYLTGNSNQNFFQALYQQNGIVCHSIYYIIELNCQYNSQGLDCDWLLIFSCHSLTGLRVTHHHHSCRKIVVFNDVFQKCYIINIHCRPYNSFSMGLVRQLFPSAVMYFHSQELAALFVLSSSW